MRVLFRMLAALRRTFYVVWGATGMLAFIGFLSQARDNGRFYGSLSLKKNAAGFSIIFLGPLSLVWLSAQGTRRP